MAQQISTEALPAGAPDTSGPLAWLRQSAPPSRALFFASRWLPSELVLPMGGIVAWSRTLDSVAGRLPRARYAPADPESTELRQEAVLRWAASTRRAYHGQASGHHLVDCVLRDARESGVRFEHIEIRVLGVLQDVTPQHFSTFDTLRGHTWRVSGALGGWMAERAGVRDPVVIDRAYELGHAMQLSSIVRNVGEDLSRGRCYLPDDLLDDHGVAIEQIARLRQKSRGRVPRAFARLLDDLMERANRSYELALEAAAALPGTFARAVIVAGRVQQGLHRALRDADHDSLRYRVRLGRLERMHLAAGALAELARMDRTRLRLAPRAVIRPELELVPSP